MAERIARLLGHLQPVPSARVVCVPAAAALDAATLNSRLHHAIIKHILEKGFAPTAEELAKAFALPLDKMVAALKRLFDDHGVVLQPHRPEIWKIHPFSLSPTNFWVTCRSSGRCWWAECGWCSLGVAALAKEDVTIHTSFGAEGRPVRVHVRGGRVLEENYVIHFPTPMRHAWDNVTHTCSQMLYFESVADVDAWCARHRLPRGDVQPLGRFWQFAREWYGRHADENWVKWTGDQARALFAKHGLKGDTWELASTKERF